MNKNKHECILKKNKKVFRTIASSISGESISIIPSKDEIGSYYEKNIILPHKINVSKKININKKCYIYKILFSLTSKDLNFYIKNKKENIDYKIITSLLTVKIINKNLINKFKNCKKLIKNIYPIVNNNRKNIKDLKERCLLIEIIIKKLTYDKIKEKINLTQNEKKWLFNIENTFNVNEKNITEYANTLYSSLKDIYKNYQEPNFYLLWGYIYERKNIKTNKIFKQTVKNKIKKQKTSIKNLILNKVNTIIKKNTIQPIFDYKKTHDKYNNSNKNTDKSTNFSENINKNFSANIDHSISLAIKSNIIKNITLNNQENNLNSKKLTYKEWDYTKNYYKNNWCHIFVKNMYSKYEDNFKINDNIKSEIILFKKYFKLILNKKIINKKKTYGYTIDLDAIVDNYHSVINNTYDKVYVQKNKAHKDTAIILLLDSSLSTEGFFNDVQTLEKLKNITYLIAEGINHTQNKFIISTFNSNTRHDCRYLIIKNFNENWNKKKHTLSRIKPVGYTRIGPALRHSITILKNMKTEKKLIILLSDGTPTDYDEYEGNYGLNDIKKAIKEAKKQKIIVKTILINNKSNDLFINIIKKTNCYKINENTKIYKKIIQLFNSI